MTMAEVVVEGWEEDGGFRRNSRARVGFFRCWGREGRMWWIWDFVGGWMDGASYVEMDVW